MIYTDMHIYEEWSHVYQPHGKAMTLPAYYVEVFI